jgi:ATP-dependent protease ClpP protease subunit
MSEKIIINQKTSGVFSRPLSELVEIYISGIIGPAEDYTEIFNKMRNLSELDFVKVHINSYGGDLFTAIQFMRVFSETSATVVCSVEGACMSAATLIFLSANKYEISSHSAFMFHNYSGFAGGKGGEMIDQLLHERTWSENLWKEVYKDFLTKEEIQSLLDNKDIWMDCNEVISRLEKKAKTIHDKTEKKKVKTEKPIKKQELLKG